MNWVSKNLNEFGQFEILSYAIHSILEKKFYDGILGVIKSERNYPSSGFPQVLPPLLLWECAYGVVPPHFKWVLSLSIPGICGPVFGNKKVVDWTCLKNEESFTIST
jgi:hypothetical protein